MTSRARRISGFSGRIIALRSWLRDTIPGTDRRLSYGVRSEHAAARHLRWRGYKIVARNFRAAGAEIDVIIMDRGTLVFVEVKARMSDSAGVPEAAVDARKQYRIRKAAEIFADRRGSSELPIRFDVIAISGDGRARKLEHLRDAF